MADYWGVHNIAARMGAAPTTILRWHLYRGFLMYKRGKVGHKPVWFTNDTLINAWEIAQCRIDHAARVEARAKRLSQAKP